MSRELLVEMAKRGLAHAEAGTIVQADDVYRVAAQDYVDPERWHQEMRQVFRRMPLMLAMTAELREPGDYKAMDAGGVPVLIARQDDGSVKAFVNMCSHRGAQIMEEGCGNANRFTCPYHAWSYSTGGELFGILSNKDFGDIDKASNGLTELPVLERAGLIWVTTECLDDDGA